MNAIAVSEKYTDEWLILEGVKTFCEGFLKGLELPPRLSISQWADTYRKLSSESSAEPGDWDTGRAEYQRGMMDAISDINCSEITIEASAQVGKTEVLNNAIGYFIDKDPCPILLLQPNLEVAKSWSNDRLMPMIRDTPCLQGKIAENKDLIVGMTGDGVNDAPALKKANVGFAMGSGTEVAKEASDIVILDDNIMSISQAILYGRTIFKSIRKFIIYQLTCNFCALFLSIIGPFVGVNTPITIIQM